MISKRNLKLVAVAAFILVISRSFSSVKIAKIVTNPFGIQPAPVEQCSQFAAKQSAAASQAQDTASAEELQPHHYGTHGLLTVNPDGPHPIYELINKAEATWKSKLDRASTTLEEAVVEYKRRYHRAPPLGFDIWWEYVQDKNVQLPDEYDQIYHDLEPFWGITPVDLASGLDQLEQQDWRITLEKRHADEDIQVITSTVPGNVSRTANNVMGLIDDVQHYIPPFRAVLSPNDKPDKLSDYTIRSVALEAAAARTFLSFSDLPQVDRSGWIQACSPSSPARHSPISLDDPLPPLRNKTFIVDHHLSMDPCHHPRLLALHGQFLSHNNGPSPQKTLVPLFSLSSTMLHHNIHTATLYGWQEDLPQNDNPPWNEKYNERLLWRGSNTGMYHRPTARWRSAHRARLIRWAHDLSGSTSVIPATRSEKEKIGEMMEIKKAFINPALLDIEFSGKPLACDPDVCKVLESEFDWRKRQEDKEARKYKYILDVDGNGWSGRFRRLLTFNSLIFKSTIYPEWFTDRIQPWVHYVPVQVDFSDLHDSLLFFRGDTNGEGAHEDLARKIGEAGRTWSENFWRKEDLTAYMFRLFLEYARVMSVDRESMNYDGDDREVL